MPEQNAAQTQALSDAEIKSIRTFYSAFTQKKPEFLDQALAPNWQDIPLMPGQGPGPQGLKPFLDFFFSAFPDMKITVHEIFGTAGRAGVRAEITGTHRGELFGIAATGKQVSVAMHEFHYLKDGKITHTWHLEDWFGMLHQIGAWPPAAATQKEGQ